MEHYLRKKKTECKQTKTTTKTQRFFSSSDQVSVNKCARTSIYVKCMQPYAVNDDKKNEKYKKKRHVHSQRSKRNENHSARKTNATIRKKT